MSSECTRIADQLKRAFNNDPWHGPSLHELLRDVTDDQALARPVTSAHTIWELVVHIDLYVGAALDALHGTPMPRWYGTEGDWPEILDSSVRVWITTRDSLFAHAVRLADAVEVLPDTRLQDTVPGREYNFYHLLHGIVQHSIYHGGQIAVLRKALTAESS